MTTDSMENSLKQTRESSVFQSILEATGDALLIVTPQKSILEYNSQFTNLWNFDEVPLSDHSASTIFSKMDEKIKSPEQVTKKLNLLCDDGEDEVLENLKLSDGRIVELYSCPIKVDGDYKARLWSFNDITGRERARKRARKVAFQDPLTNLPNRIKFLEYLQGMLLYNQSNNQQAAILCMDLNRFKRINNSIGQEAGDEVLKECVDRWNSALPDEVLMARTGGDEFMVFVPEYDQRAELENMVDDLLEAQDSPFEIEDIKINVKVNIGIALYPRDSENVDDLLSMASSAMQEARNQGYNNYEFFISEMQDAPANMVSLESDLRESLDNDTLSLHYQPQVDLAEQTIIGFEALLRWDHADHGMIPPKTTVPLAEETGLIIPVGEWVLDKACQSLVEWQDILDDNLRMSVNVSAEQIVQERRLLDCVNETIEETNINPDCLELEITEHVALRDLDFTSNLLHEFKGMEIRTSVDDFGTGHSTMTYLQELPYDCLKIDRSFIDGLTEYRQNKVMVEAMISLANELGLEVIAEGVETEEQLNLLKKLDCDTVQGFYYSRPKDSDEIPDLLKNQDQLTDTKVSA